MNKITIFYGPKDKFKEIIPAEDMTLTGLVRISDSELKEHKLKLDLSEEAKRILPNKEQGEEDVEDEENNEEQLRDDNNEIENLVAFSDEFYSIKEHAILNFVNFLEQFSIKNIYLHNPPTKLASQLERAYRSKIEIINHEYKSISKKDIIEINNKFSCRIIGQEGAKISLLTSLYSLTKENQKPIVILMYGPTGVGKTETAKFLGEVFNEKIFKKQFSMFQNNDFVSYLFGGDLQKGCFSKDLLDRGSNIILLEEFDKVPPILYNAFYQMFDEGIYEDNFYKVNLENSIIICTSNFRSKNAIIETMGDSIFFRFDSVIKYNNLSNKDVKQIISKEYHEQISLLNETEKEVINKHNLLNEIIEHSNMLTNTREIRSLIRQSINTIILYALVLNNN